jgi:hypothetical protein
LTCSHFECAYAKSFRQVRKDNIDHTRLGGSEIVLIRIVPSLLNRNMPKLNAVGTAKTAHRGMAESAGITSGNYGENERESPNRTRLAGTQVPTKNGSLAS